MMKKIERWNYTKVPSILLMFLIASLAISNAYANESPDGYNLTISDLTHYTDNEDWHVHASITNIGIKDIANVRAILTVDEKIKYIEIVDYIKRNESKNAEFTFEMNDKDVREISLKIYPPESAGQPGHVFDSNDYKLENKFLSVERSEPEGLPHFVTNISVTLTPNEALLITKGAENICTESSELYIKIIDKEYSVTNEVTKVVFDDEWDPSQIPVGCVENNNNNSSCLEDISSH